jgi:hypothetical protein
MKFRLLWLLLISVFFSTPTVEGQERQKRKKKEKITQRFAVGLVAGLNTSQIDGDYQTGWDKLGISGGIKVITQLTARLKLNVELLYTEKGSKIRSEVPDFVLRRPKDRIIDIRFIEVPVLFKLVPGAETPLYVEGGFAYGRKISSEIKENVTPSTLSTFRDVESEFNSSEFSAVVGFGLFVSEDVSIGTRLVYGLSKFYRNPELEGERPLFEPLDPTKIKFLRNYAFQVMVAYNIF